MLKFLEKLFGENNEAKVNAIQPLVERINNLEDEISKLTDEELKAKTPYFKNLIENKLKDVTNTSLVPDDAPKIPGIVRNARDKATFDILNEILPEAFATVREASKR